MLFLPLGSHRHLRRPVAQLDKCVTFLLVFPFSSSGILLWRFIFISLLTDGGESIFIDN